jgi:hypothetical protein
VERFDETMIEQPATRSGVRLSSIQYSVRRDLPMLLTVRNATFICHAQLFEQLLAAKSEVSRRAFGWRIQRLVDAGLVKKLAPCVPYSGAVYTVTRSGLACLEACGEGLVSVTSESKTLANVSQVQHYLELGEIRAAFRRANLLKEWTGDLEIRSINQSIAAPLAKDYDAIVDVEFEGTEYRLALEYERYLKSAARYEEIIAAIKDENQVQLLVYFTSSIDLLYQVRAKFEDVDFPIVLVQSRAFYHHPMATRMYLTSSLGENKATFDEVLRTLSGATRARQA